MPHRRRRHRVGFANAGEASPSARHRIVIEQATAQQTVDRAIAIEMQRLQ
jgi:hypothetical protein